MFHVATNNLKEQQKLEIEIIVASYAICDETWRAPISFSSTYSRLYYIKSGRGYIEHNGVTTTLLPGNVYFIPSGTTISYHCNEGETLEKIYIHI